MTIDASRNSVVLRFLLCTVALTPAALAQQTYLKASNAEGVDEFGKSVAISGDTLVVGAWSEDSSAAGVNGLQANDTAPGSGAAYVFVRSGSSWVQQAYLKASNTDSGDGFGGAVAISGDTLVVGADHETSNATGVNGNESDNSSSRTGAAYVFVRSGTTWSQQAYLKASNSDSFDQFGVSVAISGNILVVGAPAEQSAAAGVNGDQASNNSLGAGAAYIFARNGSTWVQQAYLKASNTNADNKFGQSVSVSGTTVIVGARREDSAATGVNGNQNNTSNDAPLSGAAYVFARNGSTWSQQAYLKASNTESGDEFGKAVTISGNTVAVGAWAERSAATGVNGNQANNMAFRSGATYVFVRNGTNWSQQAYLKASNAETGDSFGWSLALDGNALVVGAYNEESNGIGINGNQSDNSLVRAGAAYVFTRSGSSWSQQAYLKASNTDGDDRFGEAVAISSAAILVGALREDSNATGVNGNQADNSAGFSGASYLFDLGFPLEPANFCNGDGGDQLGCTDCPCSNNAPLGTIGGCLNSAATSASLLATGDTSVSLPSMDTSDLRFAISGAPANAFCILNSGDAVAPGNVANPCFGLNSGAQAAAFDGLRCAIMNTRRHGGRSADGSGDVGVTNSPWGGEGGPPVGLSQAGAGFIAGQTRYFQVINRDDPLLGCMRGLNTSQAVEITFTP